MPLTVFDYRQDVRNVVVTPEIRGRFLRMEPGQVATRHSHDLGHELFLVLDGQAEFEIDGERAVLGPGQACFARRDQLHQVRTVGDQPITMYLSVTPHVEPTHTTWTADPKEGGEKEPPRYGIWRSPDRDGVPDLAKPPATLVDRHLAQLRSLADLAAASAAAQERHGAALKQALAAGDVAAARAEVDAMWAHLSPLLRAVSELTAAWNDLAPAAAPVRREYT